MNSPTQNAPQKIHRPGLYIGLSCEYSNLQPEILPDKLNHIAEEHIAEIENQEKQLQIVSPIAGKVIAPPRKPEPKLDPAIRNLNTWHGTPLDPKNKGCFVEERTHLLSIAPDER